MKRIIKILGFSCFLLLAVSFSHAQQAVDQEVTNSRSLGINVGSTFSNFFPDFIYLRSAEKKTLRLRGSIQMTQQNRIQEMQPCENASDSKTTRFSPSFAWGYQWGNTAKWARLYYGFELRARYDLLKSRDFDQFENCVNNITSFQTGSSSNHSVELGVAGIFGASFQITQRFSVSMESDVTGSIQSGWRKYQIENTTTDTTGVSVYQDEGTSSNQIYVRGGILRSIRIYANLHF